jgi:hypothetical protein
VPDQPVDDISAQTVRARLVPRFTIRALLVTITVAAIVFVMIGTASRGEDSWAWGITIGLVSVIITALAHAAWFGIVWMFMRIAHSPEAPSESQLRQIMALREPPSVGGSSTEIPPQYGGAAQG